MADVPTVSRPPERSRGPRLPRVGAVDAVGLEAQAAEFATRSLERETRRWALLLTVRATELAALEPAATPGSVEELCARAVRPGSAGAPAPRVAAVCVRPALAAVCRERLRGTGVRVVSVGAAVRGVDEVELPFDAGALLSGRAAAVFDDVAAARETVAPATLRVALETGGLGGYDAVRHASLLVAAAGAGFLAVASPPLASLPAALCVLDAIRDVNEQTGSVVGFKVCGVRSAEQAVRLAVLVHETLGPGWLTPDRFRLGGAGLLDDALSELQVPSAGA